MRMRTYPVVIVQITLTFFVFIALPVGAQSADYGDGARDALTTGTVLDMPQERPASHGTGTSPARASMPVSTPPRGMRMSRVLAGYGAPLTRHGPVGQPPITRWDYADYRLYFEYDHVLHAVVPDNPEPIAHAEQLESTN